MRLGDFCVVWTCPYGRPSRILSRVDYYDGRIPYTDRLGFIAYPGYKYPL